MSKIWVIKADGTRQPFQRHKIVKTCLRMRVSEDVAEAVLFLSSPASDYITGQVISVNGGMYM